MNERIKTLSQEAFTEAHESRIGPDGLIRSGGNPYIFYEKFAELIVRECAAFLRDTMGDDFAAEQMKEHFGVES